MTRPSSGATGTSLMMITVFCETVTNTMFGGQIFYTLKEAKVLIERWRQHYKPGPTP